MRPNATNHPQVQVQVGVCVPAAFVAKQAHNDWLGHIAYVHFVQTSPRTLTDLHTSYCDWLQFLCEAHVEKNAGLPLHIDTYIHLLESTFDTIKGHAFTCTSTLYFKLPMCFLHPQHMRNRNEDNVEENLPSLNHF